jgi:hypothetical protein
MWLVGVPVCALVAAVLAAPAHAVPPSGGCVGPADLGGEIVGTLCVGEDSISGSPLYAVAIPDVQFSKTNAHYWSCRLKVTVRNVSQADQQTAGFACRNAANHHDQHYTPGYGREPGFCSNGDLIRSWMYVEYSYLLSPRTIHRSKSLAAALTCVT